MQVQIANICVLYICICVIYTNTIYFKEISITKGHNYGVAQLQTQLDLLRFPVVKFPVFHRPSM